MTLDNNFDEDSQVFANETLQPLSSQLPVSNPEPLYLPPPPLEPSQSPQQDVTLTVLFPPQPRASSLSAHSPSDTASKRISVSDVNDSAIPAMTAPAVLPDIAARSLALSFNENSRRLPGIIGALVNRASAFPDRELSSERDWKSNHGLTPSLHEDAGVVTRIDSRMDDSNSSPADKGLRLRTDSAALVEPCVNAQESTLARRPHPGRQTIKEEDDVTDHFSVMSPISTTTAVSPGSQQLPSIRHLTGQLADLADLAGQQENRGPSHTAPMIRRHHSHSLGSSTSQSPMPFFSYPGNSHSSPAAYAYGRSPSDPTPQFSHISYANERRSSTATEALHNYAPSVHSIRAASSSGESVLTPSSADSYSTSNTTPSEGSGQTAENASRRLPLPQGAQTYRCDHEGCNSTFNTMYLLSSHKNVHSQVRTHFCPVAGCPRGQDGKGFKRKNEMIRHGLVHESPGYICPFCPEIERKYPRPDNLQRHVRVHHIDRNRDDPALREVLAQRTEGALRANRRRRTFGAIGV